MTLDEFHAMMKLIGNTRLSSKTFYGFGETGVPEELAGGELWSESTHPFPNWYLYKEGQVYFLHRGVPGDPNTYTWKELSNHET